MKFSDYQRSIRETDQRPGKELEDMTVHLLGLAGEAGSVAAAYKKYIRDGAADVAFKLRMREEIGDALWYLATIARERLPRQGTYEFIPGVNSEGRKTITVMFDGGVLGAELTDNALADDGYRFHDAFHLAYATVLGWSPVTRALMKCKRKSDADIDESEDGGRAIVIEEGVAAFAFAYAARHEFLDGVTRLDQQFLDSIVLMTHGLEVGSRKHSDFERAIIDGFEMFRQLHANNGGFVDFDADARKLSFRMREDG